MSIITIISDWNNADYYLAAVKGRIFASNEKAQVIDVNHDISSFNINETAFILRNTFKNFPIGTVHIIAVDSEWHKDYSHVIIQYQGHFFIGTDNGLFGLAFDEKPEKIIEVENDSSGIQTFPALTIFAEIAGKLAGGEKPEKFGKNKDELYFRPQMMPIIDESLVEGSVIFIDSYQNVITNISKKIFEDVGKGRKFEILVQSNHYRIDRINKRYNETSNGELLALFNAADLLEIAMARANVAEILSLTTKSSVRIKFYEL